MYIVVHPSYQSRQYRLFRLSVFVLTGLSAFAPIIHASRLFPLEQLNKQSGLPYYYVEGGVILLGALIYGTRFPERLYPGRFDIWGSSHQIFHVLVVLATSIHLLGVLNAFEWNYENRRCGAGGGAVVGAERKCYPFHYGIAERCDIVGNLTQFSFLLP